MNNYFVDTHCHISYEDYEYQDGDIIYCDVPYEKINKNKCDDYGVEFDSLVSKGLFISRYLLYLGFNVTILFPILEVSLFMLVIIAFAITVSQTLDTMLLITKRVINTNPVTITSSLSLKLFIIHHSFLLHVLQ